MKNRILGRLTYRYFLLLLLLGTGILVVSARQDTLHHSDGSYAIGDLLDGYKDGQWMAYFSNGKICSEGTFISGIRDGDWTWYHRNGRVKACERWLQGSVVEGTYWDRRGRESDLSVAFKNAEYPGGMEAFTRLITENLQYPDALITEGHEGRLVLVFQVSESGRVCKPVVTGAVHPELEREALRVLRLSGRWEPAEFHGIKTATRCSFPITFALK